MSKYSKILEEISDQLTRFYYFLDEIEVDNLNATDKATLINIRNATIAILNVVNTLIAKKNGLR